MTWLAVFLGGGVGSLARWLVVVSLPVADHGFPFPTLLANMTGAFGIAALYTLLTQRWTAPSLVRPFVGVGFFGAYTTFSIMAVEGVLLLEAGRHATAAGYWLATLVAGQAAAIAGLASTRALNARTSR